MLKGKEGWFEPRSPRVARVGSKTLTIKPPSDRTNLKILSVKMKPTLVTFLRL